MTPDIAHTNAFPGVQPGASASRTASAGNTTLASGSDNQTVPAFDTMVGADQANRRAADSTAPGNGRPSRQGQPALQTGNTDRTDTPAEDGTNTAIAAANGQVLASDARPQAAGSTGQTGVAATAPARDASGTPAEPAPASSAAPKDTASAQNPAKPDTMSKHPVMDREPAPAATAGKHPVMAGSTATPASADGPAQGDAAAKPAPQTATAIPAGQAGSASDTGAGTSASAQLAAANQGQSQAQAQSQTTTDAAKPQARAKSGDTAKPAAAGAPANTASDGTPSAGATTDKAVTGASAKAPGTSGQGVPSVQPAGQGSSQTGTEPMRAESVHKESGETRAILEPKAHGKTGTAANGGATASAQPTSTQSASQGAGGQTASTGAATPSDIRPDATQAADRSMQPPAGAQTPLPATQDAAQQGQPADGGMDAAQSDFDLQMTRQADSRASTTAPHGNAHSARFAPHTAQQMAGQITRSFNNGHKIFDIRLDPAELGKVDVRLELRADNRVHAVLTAERPETLNELQRSARDLERALADAGLDLSEDGLTFQLGDDSNAGASGEDTGSGPGLPVFVQGDDDMFLSAGAETASAPISRYGFVLSRRDSVDVRV